MDLKTECSQRLQYLLQNIGPTDIKAAVRDSGYSRVTIDKYLKGNVKNIDTALKLIDFFTLRMDIKIKQLQRND